MTCTNLIPTHTVAGDTPQSQGLLQSLTAKIINNLQVTVKNIHIRYEDKMSVPGVGLFHLLSCSALNLGQHPFAAGVTLAGFTAVSVNSQWQAAFIESTAGAIHKASRQRTDVVRILIRCYPAGKSAILGGLFRHRLAQHGWSIACRGFQAVFCAGSNGFSLVNLRG